MTADRVNATIAARLSRGRGTSSSTVLQVPAALQTGIKVLDAVEVYALKRGCVVDIVGESNSGKTRFLHAIVANLLCSPPPDPPYNPRVCWFDLNGGLDIKFLLSMISHRLNCPPQEAKFVLNALRVYNPTSTASMCESIMHLPKYFLTIEGSNGVFP